MIRPCRPAPGSRLGAPGEWRGFDTETQDGKAVLIATDRDSLSMPGGFLDCARFLVNGGDRFACWNMDYDARAILLFLPWKQLQQLHYTNWTRWHGWKVHYLPRKVLEIFEPKREGGRAARIFDVHQFFGGSLASAAPRVGMRKMDVPKSWYPRMKWALRKEPEKVIAYCINDAKVAQQHAALLLPRLMEFAKCEAPYSPAAVARSYFGPRLKFNETRWQQQIFESTYRGGRIEVFKRGHCGRGVLYDIKSAYPAALALALDPRHMTFARTRRYSADAGYGAYHIRVTIPPMQISPLAYTATPRKEEATIYPVGDLELAVDRETLKLLRSMGLNPKVDDAWEYLIDKEVLLFRDIEELFARRKKEPDLDLAIKLTLNGLYGIVCQKIDTWIKPKYITDKTRNLGGSYRERFSRMASTTHYGVGAFVTARTRRMAYELARLDPDNALFVATDGVAFRGKGPGNVRLGGGLGDWTLADKFSEAVIVGAGVYSLCVGGKWKNKMRGMYAPHAALPELLDTRRTWCSVPVTTVDTLADGMRERGAMVNVVQQLRKRLDFNFDTKRVWERKYTGRELLRNLYDSRPWKMED